MSRPKILVRFVLPLLWQGFRDIWTFWVCFVLVLGVDICGMRSASPDKVKATKEVIGWFFGNGSGAQLLSWNQMACCIVAAVLGYIFLGVTLFITVRAFQIAAKASPS